MCSACGGDYENPEMTAEPERDETDQILRCSGCGCMIPSYYLPGMVCVACLRFGPRSVRLAEPEKP